MFAADPAAVRAERLHRRADRLRASARGLRPAQAHAYTSWADELDRRALELRVAAARSPSSDARDEATLIGTTTAA
jgi:hypothetical protein